MRKIIIPTLTAANTLKLMSLTMLPLLLKKDCMF